MKAHKSSHEAQMKMEKMLLTCAAGCCFVSDNVGWGMYKVVIIGRLYNPTDIIQVHNNFTFSSDFFFSFFQGHIYW